MITVCYGHNTGLAPACGRRSPSAPVTEYSRHLLVSETVLAHGEGFDPESMRWCEDCVNVCDVLRRSIK